VSLTPRRAAPLALVSLLLAACYTYATPAAPWPAAGSRIRVDLSEAGSAELAAQVGPRVTALEGDVLRAEQEILEVAVVAVQFANGQENYWSGEPVAIPHRLVRAVRERRFSRARTLLFAGAMVATAAAVGGTTGVLGRGAGGGRPPPQR
jgi:hypothetical protein